MFPVLQEHKRMGWCDKYCHWLLLLVLILVYLGVGLETFIDFR